MKQLLTIALTITSLSLAAHTPPATYEDIRQEIEDEANYTCHSIKAKFSQEYIPTVVKTSLASIAFGILLPLAIQATKNDKTALACLYSGLASFAGYFTLLKHAELMAFKKTCDLGIADADRVYHKKLAHIHTRHYLGDIAKFQMARLEEIVKEYLAQNALPNDKNQQ